MDRDTPLGAPNMISVLTVNYHSSADLKRLADSLRRHAADQPVELIITNNSVEDTIQLPHDSALPVKVLPSPNIGFAAGINLAYREARGDVFFIANPDVIVLKDAMNRAAGYLQEHEDAGILLPRLRSPDGDVQSSVRRFYTWPVVLYARSPFRMLGFHPAFFRHYLYHGQMPETPTAVDWGLGGAMFLRRSECGEDGIFDERFFLYFEDVDLCYRTWARNRRVVYCPQVECTHAHRRHSRVPYSRAGWWHLQSLFRFIVKYRGLPKRPSSSSRRIPTFTDP